MGCGCNKGKNQLAKLSWTVDLTGTGKVFADGTVKKTFATASEGSIAIARLGLTGRVRPKPATAAA